MSQESNLHNLDQPEAHYQSRADGRPQDANRSFADTSDTANSSDSTGSATDYVRRNAMSDDDTLCSSSASSIVLSIRNNIVTSDYSCDSTVDSSFHEAANENSLNPPNQFDSTNSTQSSDRLSQRSSNRAGCRLSTDLDESNNSSNSNEILVNNNDFYICNEDEIFNDSSDEDVHLEEAAIDDDNYLHNSPLLDFIQKDSNNDTISAYFAVSVCEMLFSILKFSTAYSLPNSAVADLCKMFNSFLEIPILPDSRHMIDKLFYSGKVIGYHAVCCYCKNYIRKFDRHEQTVYCTVCNEYVHLKHPSYHDYYVTLNVEDNLRHLIENNQEYYNKVVISGEEFNENSFKDFTDGQQYKKFVASLPDNEQQSYLTLLFNSDGSPLFKSSCFSIWPIQLIVNEIPPAARCKMPVTYALWFGHDKPKMNIFLSSFAKDMNKLSLDGIRCKINDENKNIKVYAICCCVDSAARPPMQGLVQFNGYYGCSWCLHPGELVRSEKAAVVKYTLSNEIYTRRTEEMSVNNIQEAINTNKKVFGFKSATPLLLLNKFNIIDGFVQDEMHCIALGVVKQFSIYWFDSPGKPYSISNAEIDRIDKYVTQFKVPIQIARLSRSIKDRKFWKAKEWGNWLIYYSIPVLKTLEGFKKYLKHWSLLVKAIYSLLQDSININELSRADILLKQFVGQTEYYYSKEAMTYNVHQLTHIAQSVADWGPLWAHSGYGFESGNGQIIRTIHAAKGVLSQITRNLSTKENLIILEKHIAEKEDSPVLDYCKYIDGKSTAKSEKYGNNRYFVKCKLINEIETLNLPRDNSRAYEKLLKNNNVFKSCKKQLHRSDNSFAMTTTGEYIQIVQFLVNNTYDIEYVLCKKIQVQNSFTDRHSGLKTVVEIYANVTAVPTVLIDKPCVFMSVARTRYIVAVPNVFQY